MNNKYIYIVSLFSSARASQVDVGSMQQQIKMLQEELSKSVLRCNQSEDARQIAERKKNQYEEQMRQLSQKVRERAFIEKYIIMTV